MTSIGPEQVGKALPPRRREFARRLHGGLGERLVLSCDAARTAEQACREGGVGKSGVGKSHRFVSDRWGLMIVTTWGVAEALLGLTNRRKLYQFDR